MIKDDKTWSTLSDTS